MEIDEEVMVTLYDDITFRKYHTKQIGISRATFYHWKEKELIPFERDEPKGWQKLSLVECVWLGIIADLRDLGMSLNYIRLVKEKLFYYDKNILKSVLEEVVENGELKMGEEHLDGWLADVGEKTSDEIENELETGAETMFTTTILLCLLKGKECNLTICKSGVVIFLADFFDITKVPAQIQEMLQNDSQVRINVWNVITRIMQYDSVVVLPNTLQDTLTEDEQLILDLVRDERYSEIIIKKGIDGVPVNIKVVNNMIDARVVSKLYPFLKKGVYKDFSFKARNGQVIRYEETEIIKLKHNV